MEDALGPFRRGMEEDNQFFDMDTDDPFKVSRGVGWSWGESWARTFLRGEGEGGRGEEDQEGGKKKGQGTTAIIVVCIPHICLFVGWLWCCSQRPWTCFFPSPRHACGRRRIRARS